MRILNVKYKILTKKQIIIRLRSKINRNHLTIFMKCLKKQTK